MVRVSRKVFENLSFFERSNCIRLNFYTENDARIGMWAKEPMSGIDSDI